MPEPNIILAGNHKFQGAPIDDVGSQDLWWLLSRGHVEREERETIRAELRRRWYRTRQARARMIARGEPRKASEFYKG